MPAPARTAPRVTTTSTDEANRSPATHPCTRPSTQPTAARTTPPASAARIPATDVPVHTRTVDGGQARHHHTRHPTARIHRRGQLRQPGIPLHQPRRRQPRTYLPAVLTQHRPPPAPRTPAAGAGS